MRVCGWRKHANPWLADTAACEARCNPGGSAQSPLVRPAEGLVRRFLVRSTRIPGFARLGLAAPEIFAQRLGKPALAVVFALAHRGGLRPVCLPRQPALTSRRANAHSAATPPFPHRAVRGECCRSSVVERILGKAEVVSSILTGSTTSFLAKSLIALAQSDHSAGAGPVARRRLSARLPSQIGIPAMSSAAPHKHASSPAP